MRCDDARATKRHRQALSKTLLYATLAAWGTIGQETFRDQNSLENKSTCRKLTYILRTKPNEIYREICE